jgi:hypothetical protein
MTYTDATMQGPPPPPLPPLPPMPTPMPRRTRRGPIVAAFVVGAFVAGGLGFAGSAVWAGTHDDAPPARATDANSAAGGKYTADTTSNDYQSTSGWSAQDEQVVLTIIKAEPGLYSYDSKCVLGVIEHHFYSRQAFTVADPSEITSVGYEVAATCGAPDSQVGRVQDVH